MYIHLLVAIVQECCRLPMLYLNEGIVPCHMLFRLASPAVKYTAEHVKQKLI